MTKNSPTDGKWFVAAASDLTLYVCAEGCSEVEPAICTVESCNLADARLLAASKELLKALETLIDDELCHYDHHGYCQSHGLSEFPCEMSLAREAIKKAKGTL